MRDGPAPAGGSAAPWRRSHLQTARGVPAAWCSRRARGPACRWCSSACTRAANQQLAWIVRRIMHAAAYQRVAQHVRHRLGDQRRLPRPALGALRRKHKCRLKPPAARRVADAPVEHAHKRKARLAVRRAHNVHAPADAHAHAVARVVRLGAEERLVGRQLCRDVDVEVGKVGRDGAPDGHHRRLLLRAEGRRVAVAVVRRLADGLRRRAGERVLSRHLQWRRRPGNLSTRQRPAHLLLLRSCCCCCCCRSGMPSFLGHGQQHAAPCSR